jgi:hypothetical protein
MIYLAVESTGIFISLSHKAGGMRVPAKEAKQLIAF